MTDDSYLYVRTLGHVDLDAAAELLGRGMVDNPVHVPVYGADEGRRAKRHAQLMRTHFKAAPSLHIEGVERGGRLVGVAARPRPGAVSPTCPRGFAS